MKNRQPHEFKHEGRIFRNVFTQPGGAGTAPVSTETDIVPAIRFAREKTKSFEKYDDGVFQGRDVVKLYFRSPEFGTNILQGDIAEIQYNRATTQYVIEGVIEPNDNGRDDWCVECYDEVTKGPC